MEVQRQEQKAVSPQGSLYWVSDVLVCRGEGAGGGESGFVLWIGRVESSG